MPGSSVNAASAARRIPFFKMLVFIEFLLLFLIRRRSLISPSPLHAQSLEIRDQEGGRCRSLTVVRQVAVLYDGTIHETLRDLPDSRIPWQRRYRFQRRLASLWPRPRRPEIFSTSRDQS